MEEAYGKAGGVGGKTEHVKSLIHGNVNQASWADSLADGLQAFPDAVEQCLILSIVLLRIVLEGAPKDEFQYGAFFGWSICPEDDGCIAQSLPAFFSVKQVVEGIAVGKGCSLGNRRILTLFFGVRFKGFAVERNQLGSRGSCPNHSFDGRIVHLGSRSTLSGDQAHGKRLTR